MSTWMPLIAPLILAGFVWWGIEVVERHRYSWTEGARFGIMLGFIFLGFLIPVAITLALM